jgi:hypothetical protein
VFAKQMALWETSAGFLLLDIVALPGAGYFYFRVLSLGANSPGFRTAEEQRIRELAGQEERNRLAQDLHDSVKQQIYSIQTNLAAAQARWASDAGGAHDAIDRARASARDAVTEMTALLDRLRRDPVESVGLAEAVRRQCEALGHQTGADVKTHFGRLPEPECLRPSTMTISNMRKRADEIGAHVDIESRPGEGCTLTLRLPIPDPTERRRSRHQLGLAAALVPLAPAAFIALLWPEARPYIWPLASLSAALALFHGLMLSRLQWRSAKP